MRSLQSNAVRNTAVSATVPTQDEEVFGPSSEPADALHTEYDSFSSCLLLNVQSLNPSARSRCSWKIPYLNNIVRQKSHTCCIPFIALTETWLKPYVQDAQISIEGYYTHRCDRNTRVGGGVLLYSHQDLHITNTEKLDTDSCQLLMCTSEPAKMIICVLYRPPEAPVNDFKNCLEAVHEYTLGKEDYDTCFLGDFNLPNISWDPPMVANPNTSTELMESFMNNHLCSQYILQPTRKENTLDLFISNSASLVTHVDVTPTRMSDHNLVEIFMSYNPCQPNINLPPTFEAAAFRSLDFTKADFLSISNRIESLDWVEILDTHGMEGFPEFFKATLLSICQDHCPPKSQAKGDGSYKMRILSRKKRKLQDRLNKLIADPTSSPESITFLENEVALLHYDIRDTIISERHFRENQAVGKVKSNPKYFYSYAKRFSKQKQSISMLFDERNNICTDPQQIANILKNQFTSVFSNPEAVDMMAADFAPPSNTCRFEDTELNFSEEDIVSAIDDIKADSAPGPDGIPSVLLKSCKHALARPIHLLWSLSFDSGEVPAFYKSSLVCPLYKKGSHATASNYRPVSLISHIIKIFERC